jgi:hypothetical protein
MFLTKAVLTEGRKCLSEPKQTGTYTSNHPWRHGSAEQIRGQRRAPCCLLCLPSDGFWLEQHIVHKPHKLIYFEWLLDDHRAIGLHIGKPGLAVQGGHDKDWNAVVLKLFLD